jgi:hypothetical protein
METTILESRIGLDVVGLRDRADHFREKGGELRVVSQYLSVPGREGNDHSPSIWVPRFGRKNFVVGRHAQAKGPTGRF